VVLYYILLKIPVFMCIVDDGIGAWIWRKGLL